MKNEKNKYDVYMLNIEPIKNVYSGLELCLGDFNNDEKNRYWGYEFNKNLDLHIGKLERCRENLNKEPLKVELVDIFNDEYANAFIQQAKLAEAMPSVSEMHEFWLPFSNQLQRIFKGKIPVAEGLQEVVYDVKSSYQK